MTLKARGKKKSTDHYRPLIQRLEHLVAQSSSDADFTHKFMFGGVSLYARGIIFGVIGGEEGSLYKVALKLPADGREKLATLGASEPDYSPVSPSGSAQSTTLPQAVLNDDSQLADWITISLHHVWKLTNTSGGSEAGEPADPNE